MKKLLVILLVTACCICCVACGGTGNTNNTAEMKTNLRTAVSDMMEAAILTEKILNNNIKMWNPYDDGDVLYVENVYYNDATWEECKRILYGTGPVSTIEETRGYLSDLKSANSALEKSNKKMIHWPDNMSEEKNIYEALYDAYLNLYNLSTKPSGNFKTYSENANSYVNEFSTQYKKIQAYLE